MNTYLHKEAVEFLNSQCWHDSVVYEINLVRTNSADQAIILLDLISDYDEWQSKKTRLIFSDCYYIETRMNGGVVGTGGECVSDADASLTDKHIDDVVGVWRNIDVDLPNLFHFSMCLASTGSEVNIVCKSMSIEAEEEGTTHDSPPPLYPTG